MSLLYHMIDVEDVYTRLLHSILATSSR